MSSTALVTIGFHGDTLEGIECDGKVWASLLRFSENLGVNPDGQRRKLKNKAWACTKEMLVHDASGVSVTKVGRIYVHYWSKPAKRA